MSQHIRITHKSQNEIIAEGPLGIFDIMSFEGNFYIPKKHLKTNRFKSSFIPGFCIYKFLYVWMDYITDSGKERFLGWYYWLPNPLLFFTAFRIAVPQRHTSLKVEYI